MLSVSSTRNKPKSNERNQQPTSRFFKRPINFYNDQNEKNHINYLEKIMTLKKGGYSKQSSSTLSKEVNPKKTIGTLTNGKSMQFLVSTPSIYNNSNTLEHKNFKKDKSVKNLKISNSIEFPKMLGKSISQTTVNRKMDENKIRMLQKIGVKKRMDPTIDKYRLKINNFRLGKKLGSGRFGSVYLAEQKQTHLIYAIKVMNKLKIKQAQMQQQVFWQIKLQIFMNHPNLLKMYGCFHDNKNIYLILEFCSICLFKQFRIKGKFIQEQTAYYGKQMISAMKYMHNESIIHRDIKPENILIQFGVLKLSDFGWSTYAPIYKRQTFCGTADYVPPEIVKGNLYDQRVDIWALGILLYELSSGNAPFETRDQNITYEKILRSECKFPKYFSKQLKQIIKQILDKNPLNRPNLDEIQKQQWFEKYKSIGRFISKQIWSSWKYLINQY